MDKETNYEWTKKIELNYKNEDIFELLKWRENEICWWCGRTKKACQAANWTWCAWR